MWAVAIAWYNHSGHLIRADIAYKLKWKELIWGAVSTQICIFKNHYRKEFIGASIHYDEDCDEEAWSTEESSMETLGKAFIKRLSVTKRYITVRMYVGNYMLEVTARKARNK